MICSRCFLRRNLLEFFRKYAVEFSDTEIFWKIDFWQGPLGTLRPSPDKQDNFKGGRPKESINRGEATPSAITYPRSAAIRADRTKPAILKAFATKRLNVSPSGHPALYHLRTLFSPMQTSFLPFLPPSFSIRPRVSRELKASAIRPTRKRRRFYFLPLDIARGIKIFTANPTTKWDRLSPLYWGCPVILTPTIDTISYKIYRKDCGINRRAGNY